MTQCRPSMRPGWRTDQGRKSRWLPDMDSNHDKQIQNLLCYHYTIGQTEAVKPLGHPNRSGPGVKYSADRGGSKPVRSPRHRQLSMPF